MAQRRGIHWCITIHFQTQEDRDGWTYENAEAVERAIFGRESGEGNTWHIQGYIQFKQRKRLGQVKAWLDDPTAHCEARRGTAAQAWDYCAKEDQNPLTIGERPTGPDQGRRTDLEQVYDGILAGNSLEQILDDHPGTVIRNLRNIERIRHRLNGARIPKFRQVQVVVIWGAPGVGKTRHVVEAEDDLYIADLAGRGWWDGYDGQEAVLIDDFYGQIKLTDMLRIADGYRLQLNVKGSTTWAAYTKLYITSNEPPEKWWHGGTDDDKIPEDARAAFHRRIDEVIHKARPFG